MLNLFAQNKLGVFQGLIVEQPVRLSLVKLPKIRP